METAAKIVLAAGVALVLLGGGLYLAARLGVERLPGDVAWRRGNVTLYAPIGLMILLSVILTIVLNLVLRR